MILNIESASFWSIRERQVQFKSSRSFGHQGEWLKARISPPSRAVCARSLLAGLHR